jgi:hypothetical protein
MRQPGTKPRRAWIFAGWMLAGGSFATAHAQYPGRVAPNKGAAAAPELRATAVLEYTGDLAKPTAARLIPLAVWDGERYQPGGLYLADPVPLTVESGTVYELFDAGASKGLFNVRAAANVSGSWVATGSYQKPAPPKVAKLKPSKALPQFVKDAPPDDGKPHFAHRPPADSGASQTTSSSGSGSGSSSSGSGSTSASDAGSSSGSSTSASDPDKPTLHRRTDSGAGSSSGSGSDSGSGSTTSSTAPSVDPDRPTLHRPSDSSSGSDSGSGSSSSSPSVDPDRPTLHKQSTTNPNDNGAPVSATTNIDPDRPHLGRGRPADQEQLDAPSTVEIAKLSGVPDNLKLMAAVSDAKTAKEPRSYVYSWADPEDAKKMQAALEEVAQNLVAGKPVPEASGQSFGSGSPTPGTKPVAARASSAKPGTARKAAAPKKPALPDLTDEQFKAYELSFGGGATLVFMASSGQGDATKWVTIIAKPDFNGVPLILFKQVTSEAQLDAVPRMRLVDAVDTDADNRAELIFELAGRTDQQFAIYKVHDRSVEQVFSTGGSTQ